MATERVPPEGNAALEATNTSGPTQTVRVAIAKLDALTNQISEIISVQKKSQARLLESQILGNQLDLAAAALRQLHTAIPKNGHAALSERATTFTQYFDAFQERFRAFQRQAAADANAENLLTEQLPEDIKRLRMRPFATLEDHLRRCVRDAARHCQKEINFSTVGLQTEADQVVLDILRDPLMHILRNAVDHGIEGASERQRAAKDPVGHIHVAIESRGATVAISIRDDGRGMDPQSIRAQAIARGLLTEAQSRSLSHKEIIELVFMPGLSTAAQPGVVSGRGIGMDVVRQAVHIHHGTINIATQPGKGTTIEVTMPLSFATIQGLIVRILGQDFALPMYGLERLLRFTRKDVIFVEGQPTVLVEEQPIALVSMGEILELQPKFSRQREHTWEEDNFHSEQSTMQHAAVLRSSDAVMAFLVDDFIGESELVVKDLPPVLGKVRNVSGATITWSGEVLVILNTNQLIASALHHITGSRPDTQWSTDAPPSRRILVCDDSLTTRTLEKNILIAAGYDVATANSGAEGLAIAERESFQLMVLDVDMPEIDGFELTARLRAMPKYREVPIILVTSRDSDEDKRRGLSAGADAYITKNAFTQRTFLETVRRFLA